MKDKKGGLFTSAQIGLQDVADRFEPLLQQGRDILFVAVSSGLSGTYNSTCLVANELMEKYPERHIRCVDTLRYCGAEGMLVIAATRLRAAGKTLDETADWLEENRLRVHQMGVLEDLFFCKRMGRVSGAAAVMGTLVGIRPLADINEKGLSDVIGKTRGLAPGAEGDRRLYGRTVERPEEQIMLLSHSDRRSARRSCAPWSKSASTEGAARCTGVPVVRRVDRPACTPSSILAARSRPGLTGGAQPDRGADGKNKIIARSQRQSSRWLPFFAAIYKIWKLCFGTCQIRASYNRKSWKNLLIFQKTRGKIFTTIGSGVCRGVWEGVPMKHLLRAMGAAMLAALLLSACSTPQEQTEPSAPQTTQATQAATGATEESATEARNRLRCRVTLAAA